MDMSKVRSMDMLDDDDFDCRLCVEIRDFDNSLFAHTYPGVLSRNAFFETDYLQVMIPAGPLCEGHLLAAAKEHAWSFGHVSQDILLDLITLLSKVTDFLKARYGRIILFEHGPMSKLRRGGCCLEHAHMNILPIPESFNVLAEASKYLSFMPTDIYQLKTFVERDEPYIFFQSQEEGSFAAPAPEGANQFFRKLLVSEMPGSEWDWRSHPQHEFVKAMVNMMKAR